jgi:two-component system, chemotaxis family, protein-glutamate methylesterase/glutaminase
MGVPAPSGPRRPAVALVASAGGLQAVASVLTSLPPGFPAPVIVLIHQQPDRVSELPHILSGRCALPVVHAEHGMSLEPGHVVVAPPGSHLLVTAERTLALVRSGAAPPSRPSADLLLTSLALAVRQDAIAVVLSGGGHDGATGATAVHTFGGTILATDEKTSVMWSMPRATIDRDSAVDHVVALPDVAGVLIGLVAAPAR